MRLSATLLVGIATYPVYTLCFWIGFVWVGAPILSERVDQGDDTISHPLPRTANDDPLMGFVVYNVPDGTYTVGGIVLYKEPAKNGVCYGEPDLIVTIGYTPGVYFVNLIQLGIKMRFGCWKIYDRETNAYQLTPGGYDRKKYEPGALEDLIFRKKKNGGYVKDSYIRDHPEPGEPSTYTYRFKKRYGVVPTFLSDEETDEGPVTTFDYTKMQNWVSQKVLRNWMGIRARQGPGRPSNVMVSEFEVNGGWTFKVIALDYDGN
ncbi:hypothetical protein ABW19_dt0209307 [Dactylella cylindrospora]|nr:hypothetical protein ABW19_dt0209307 [Dactylella cylindrospora]